jgi:hypothetical protein
MARGTLSANASVCDTRSHSDLSEDGADASQDRALPARAAELGELRTPGRGALRTPGSSANFVIPVTLGAR